MSTTVKKPVPPQWVEPIAAWLDHLRAQGLRPESIATRRRHIAYLLRSEPKTPEDLTVNDVLAWAAQQPWAAETRKAYYASFRSFLNWIRSCGIGDPTQGGRLAIPRVPRPHPSPRPLPTTLVDNLLAARDPRVRLAALLALRAGLRRAEIAVIRRCDLIDDLLGVSLIVHGKGGKQRIVPLADNVVNAIHQFQRRSGAQDWLFIGHDDGHISPTWLGKLVNQQLPKPWSLHCLRHRFATDLYQQTHDLILVQQLLGHESVATTQTYLAVPSSLAREALNRIAA